MVVTKKDASNDYRARRAHLRATRYADRDTVAGELQHHIKSYIGVSAQVEVLDPFAIERVTIGKAKRVIDKRPKV